MAQIANRPPSRLRSYRWQEVILFILPVVLLLLSYDTTAPSTSGKIRCDQDDE